VLRRAAAGALLACALAAPALAATPSVALARKLKGSMQAYYAKTQPGLVVTTVACTIASSGKSARCQAHFAVAAKRAVGVFTLSVLIDTSTGTVTTRTVAASCKDAKTGARLSC
jgi:hypothetical protein